MRDESYNRGISEKERQMDQIELRATTREVLGKKVKSLRHQGITPMHLFGHGIESVALQCDTTQLKQVLTEAGKTRLIGLKIDKARKTRNTVVREIQRNARTGELLHVDFYQVRMAEKIKVEVPIVLVGEAPALKTKGNMLMQELSSLSIECLPDEIPPSVELDLSPLAEAEQAIHVKDVVLDEGVTIFDDPEHIVVKISVPRIEKVEEVVVEEAVAEEVAEAPEEAQPSEEESTEE
jgi:large subunit ribosomal protein L25